MTTAATNGRKPRVLVAAEHAAAAEVEHAPGLADALLAFHAEAPKLRTNADGQIQSRTYRYVTLDGVLDDVEPLLLKHGLLWTAMVTLDGGQPVALYRMLHVASGEDDEWTGPLPCVDPGPQALGSAITYMRRYTLVAYLNLAPGDDDDGHAASTGRPPVNRYADIHVPQIDDPAHDPAPAQPTAAAPRQSERPANAKQRGMLYAKARDAGLTQVQFANVVMVAKGEPPRDTDDQDAAQRWLKRELDRLPARLVDAVVEGIEQR